MVETDIHDDLIERLRRDLLSWFDQNQRDLPWRKTSDAYRVWVSEVMLQQTQVASVMSYYKRFLEKFPTLADLATASLDEVLKAWEGMGYYARARNLHAAARQVVSQYGGHLPSSYAALRRLPGLGDYTAGAVASIAFGEQVPAVDGNVKRVLTRLFAITGNVDRSSTLRRLRDVAASLVPPDRPGAWNQALMELGATLCSPSSPGCTMCPFRADCRAFAQGIQETLPVRSRRKPTPHYDVTAGVIRRPDDALLITQREPTAMLGGLWKFPGTRCNPSEMLEDCLRRGVYEEVGLEVEIGQPVTTIRHAYTHFRITLHAFECRYLGGEPRALGCADWRWVLPADLLKYAFPVTDQKIAVALG